MISFRKIAHLILVALIAGLSACAIEEENKPRPDEVFVKYFGASGTQEMVDMIIEPDSGNVVIIGKQTLAEVGADGNMIIIKADTNGNEYNQVVISLENELFSEGDTNRYATEDNPASIIHAQGSGYLVAGTFKEIIDNQLGASYLYWIQLSDQLDIVKWDTIHSSNGVMEGGYIIQSQDNNVVILGSTTNQGLNDFTPNAGFQYYLVKRDFNADTTIFEKTYGYANSDEKGTSLFQTSEGNLTILGQTDRIGSAGGARGVNVSVMILNPLATAQLSAKEYGLLTLSDNPESDDIPVDAIRNSSGYVVVGTSSLGQNTQAFVMGISNSGGLIFRNTLDSQWDIPSTGSSVAQTVENDLFVVGGYPQFNIDDPLVDQNLWIKNDEVMVMRTNPFGKPKSGVEANFGLVGGDDVANKVLRLASGSMLIGATIDFGSGQQMIALKKMNDQAILQRP